MTRFGIAFLSVLLVAPTHAWTGMANNKVPKSITTTSESNVAADWGRHVTTLGLGCFLAAATSFASPALADAGRFSYDPNLGGPETWSTLAVEGNQCSGRKQSPIDIRPTACNVGANYEMKVRFCLPPPKKVNTSSFSA